MPETAVTSLGSIVTSLGSTVTTRTGLDAGLDAHYKLDETSGTVVIDSSGNGNHGTYVNSPTLNQPGQIGRAVAYSSGTDHATIPDHPAIHLGAGLADFSISLWLKTSSSSFQHIVSNYAGVDSSFELLMHTSGTPYFIGRDAGGIRQWNPTSSLATPFNDGDWHNILLTFEFGGTAGATVRYYLDGALDYSAALPSWTPTYASALGYIAQRYDGVNPYVGLIDDIRFYNRLLDVDDGEQLYQEGFPKLSSRTSIGLGIGL